MKIKHWIPNIFTLGNLVLGFTSITFIVKGNYNTSALLILFAMVLDGLDGRVARKFSISSELGKELDSLCDLVSFGIVPALLIYQMSFKNFGIFGLLAAVTFPVCGAFRLARFNLQKPMGYFTGLPITIAGGTVISMVLSDKNLDLPIYIPLILGLSILMVSTVKYPNFKKMSSAQGLKLFALASLVALIIAFKSNPGQMIFLYHAGYVLSGIAAFMLKQVEAKLNPIVGKITGK